MQITTYLETRADHELSGNVIDLCPVGALTSASPTASRRGRGSCKKTPAIDVTDAVGTNIRLDSRGREVLRVLPRINDDVNEEWLARQGPLPGRRPDPPPARPAVDPRERQAARGELGRGVRAIAESCKRRAASVAAIAGDLVDCETMFAAKKLLGALGSTLLEGRQTGLDYDATQPGRGELQLDLRRASRPPTRS